MRVWSASSFTFAASRRFWLSSCFPVSSTSSARSIFGFCNAISGSPALKLPPTVTTCLVTTPSTGVVTRVTGLFTIARSDDRVKMYGNITDRTTQMMNTTIP